MRKHFVDTWPKSEWTLSLFKIKMVRARNAIVGGFILKHYH